MRYLKFLSICRKNREKMDEISSMGFKIELPNYGNQR